jgi:hypothetical protein
LRRKRQTDGCRGFVIARSRAVNAADGDEIPGRTASGFEEQEGIPVMNPCPFRISVSATKVESAAAEELISSALRQQHSSTDGYALRPGLKGRSFAPEAMRPSVSC